MDRRERIGDTVASLRAFLSGFEADIWTALPAIVESYDPNEITVTGQPAIMAKLRGVNAQTYSDLQLPLCIHCPVIMPRGGGFGITLPIAKGDEGLLVFASRCIDGWWQSGGVRPQAEMRMHDLSDGFFIPGASSQVKLPSATPSTNSLQIRSDDGQVYIEIASGHVVNIVAPGGVNITGDLKVTGAVIAGQGGPDQVGLQTHEHPANNVPPTPGT